jgi:hypothetical protein
MNCLFFGPIANHALVGRLVAFRAAGIDVMPVNVSTSPRDWRADPLPLDGLQPIGSLVDPYFRDRFALRRFVSEGLRILSLTPEHESVTRTLRDLVAEHPPDFAVTHYGVYAIHVVRLVKRICPGLPVIDIVNVVPAHLNGPGGLRGLTSGWWGRLEDLAYRRWLEAADGVIYANLEMSRYVAERYGKPKHQLIAPDYLPVAWQGEDGCAVGPSPTVRSEEPHVVYLGAPERHGPLIDALDEHFLELAAVGIHVHAGALGAKVIETGYGHVYPQMNDADVFGGKLAEMARRFDAALVTYNVRIQHDRFRTTYPTRLFTSLTAGIPIAVMSGYFDSCERFVREKDVGFCYSSAADLRLRLADKSLLQRLRENARRQRSQFTAESQANELRQYVLRVLERGEDAPYLLPEAPGVR